MNELTSVNILANLESEIASSGISITDDEKENLYALAKAIGGAYGQLSSIDLYTSSGIKLTLKIDQTQT
jgi:hypothetical protein